MDGNREKNFNEEQALLTRLLTGDEKAVSVWFRRYQPLLDNYLKRKIDSNFDREEIVQEVFVTCLQNLSRFNRHSSFKTWMFAIANHEAADYYRKRYAKKMIQALPLLDHLLSNNEIIYDSHEVALKIRRVLSSLGERTKELLMMKYIDKKPVKEIAEIVGQTPKSVESELFRARREFKKVYNAEED